MGLKKRDESGLLASLYELPNLEGWLEPEQVPEAFGIQAEAVVELQPLPQAKHIFSHVEWHMKGYRLLLKDRLPDTCIAAEKDQLKEIYALPNAFGRYTKLIK